MVLPYSISPLVQAKREGGSGRASRKEGKKRGGEKKEEKERSSSNGNSGQVANDLIGDSSGTFRPITEHMYTYMNECMYVCMYVYMYVCIPKWLIVAGNKKLEVRKKRARRIHWGAKLCLCFGVFLITNSLNY